MLRATRRLFARPCSSARRRSVLHAGFPCHHSRVALGAGVNWTSGAVYTPAEGAAMRATVDAAEAATAARLAELRDDESLPLVFLDAEINGAIQLRRNDARGAPASPRCRLPGAR